MRSLIWRGIIRDGRLLRLRHGARLEHLEAGYDGVRVIRENQDDHGFVDASIAGVF